MSAPLYSRLKLNIPLLISFSSIPVYLRLIKTYPHSMLVYLSSMLRMEISVLAYLRSMLGIERSQLIYLCS